MCVCEEDVYEKRVKKKERGKKEKRKRIEDKTKLIHTDKQSDKQTIEQIDTNHSMI